MILRGCASGNELEIIKSGRLSPNEPPRCRMLLSVRFPHLDGTSCQFRPSDAHRHTVLQSCPSIALFKRRAPFWTVAKTPLFFLAYHTDLYLVRILHKPHTHQPLCASLHHPSAPPSPSQRWLLLLTRTTRHSTRRQTVKTLVSDLRETLAYASTLM